jgi:hypothetical protein
MTAHPDRTSTIPANSPVRTAGTYPSSYVYFVAYAEETSVGNCYIPVNRPITSIEGVKALRDALRRQGHPGAVILSFIHLPDEHLTGGGMR